MIRGRIAFPAPLDDRTLYMTPPTGATKPAPVKPRGRIRAGESVLFDGMSGWFVVSISGGVAVLRNPYKESSGLVRGISVTRLARKGDKS